MFSQWRPAFDQEQAMRMLEIMRLVWRKERRSLLIAMVITLLMIVEPISHPWILVALVWIGTSFSLIEAWPSRNPVKISVWIRLFVISIGIGMYVFIWFSDPSIFLDDRPSAH